MNIVTWRQSFGPSSSILSVTSMACLFVCHLAAAAQELHVPERDQYRLQMPHSKQRSQGRREVWLSDTPQARMLRAGIRLLYKTLPSSHHTSEAMRSDRCQLCRLAHGGSVSGAQKSLAHACKGPSCIDGYLNPPSAHNCLLARRSLHSAKRGIHLLYKTLPSSQHTFETMRSDRCQLCRLRHHLQRILACRPRLSCISRVSGPLPVGTRRA